MVAIGINRDLRWASVEAAVLPPATTRIGKQSARLASRTGRSKALVAIGRRLLIAVWHTLTKMEPDRFAVPEKVAATIFQNAYRIGIENLPDGMSAREYTIIAIYIAQQRIDTPHSFSTPLIDVFPGP